MYRKLASALLVASAISSQYAVAVSLGEITMHSALNEPLEAGIKLTNTNELDASQILVRLASPSEFEDAGMERTFFLSEIKFSITLDGKGGGTVHLSSKRPLNEPFLDFLLESKWPTGRMLRSYTVLVDLPVYKEPQAVTIAPNTPKQPTKSATKTVEQSASQTSNVSRAAKPETQSLDEGISSGEYLTQRDDTLWRIAQRVASGSDLSVQQTMLAIQRENPNAFFNGNINRLKQGVVLRLPDHAAIRDISAQAAIQNVAQQNKQWQNPQLESSEGFDNASSQPIERDGHLRLVSAGEGLAAGKTADGQTADATQQQLTATKDELRAANLENQELNTRVQSLDTQVQQLQRLVELKNAELASLQKELGKEVSVKQAEVTLEKQDADSKPAAKADKPVVAETKAVKEKVADKAKVEKKPKAEPVKPTESESSFFEQFIANPIYIGILGLLIALGVGFILLRKRAQDEKQLNEDNQLFSFDESTDYQQDAASEAQEESQDVEALADDLDFAEDELSDSDVAESRVLLTGDAIEEAKVYIEYGRYDEAVDILTTAAQQNAYDAELQLKLLEAYVATNNKTAFQQVFAELQSRGEHDAVAQAKELLSASESANDWLDDLPEGLHDFASDIDESFDLDEELDFSSEFAEEPALEETAASDDEFDLDLDLDSDFAALQDETVDFTEQAETSSDVLADELDLDLDSAFSFDEEAETAAVSETVEQADGELEDFDLDLDFSGLDEDASTEADLAAFDETDVLAAVETAEQEDFSAGDFGFSDEEVAAAVEADGAEVGFDLEDLDFSDDEVSSIVAEASEEAELSLDDFDLDFDDLGDVSEASLADADSALDEVALADFGEQEIAETEQSGAAVAASQVADEPHTSAPIEELSDDELSFVDGLDEVATKLDLVQAYIDMGDVDGAREILLEVLKEGNDEQRSEANNLMSSLD